MVREERLWYGVQSQELGSVSGSYQLHDLKCVV